jgi:hypothetical protein
MTTPEATEPAQQWAPEKEREFQLLLAETEHANKQIGSYMDLQIKLIGFLFSALGAFVAILFAASLSSSNMAKAFLTISLIASFGVFQTAITYGTALSYIGYKAKILAPRLKELLQLGYQPLEAVRAFTSAGVSRAVFFSTCFVMAGITFLNLCLLRYCWELAGDNEGGIKFGIIVALIWVVGTVVAQILMGRALQRIGVVRSTAHLQSAAEEQDEDRA